MKIAYLVFHDATSNDGVIKKVASQIKAWRGQGHDVEVFCTTPRLGESILSGRQYLRKGDFSSALRQNESLLDDVREFSPDVVYFRYISFSCTLHKILNDYICVTELNSHDVNEFRLLARLERTLRSRLRYYVYRFFRGLILSRVRGMVSVTRELAASPDFSKYSKPIFVVPNSIDLEQYEPMKDLGPGRIGLFFIGTPGQPWHGVEHIERLAEALPEFDFNVVGYSGVDRSNLFFHGYLGVERYREIMRRSHICIGSLSLYKNGMQEACPLKVREYIAAGFPVFIGYSDTAFLDCSPAWVLQADMQGELVEVRDALRAFCLENRDYVVPPESAKKFVGSDVLEMQRISFLEDVLRRERSA
ncbi:glycosyltransferase involved in cell wall biosynthesis [Pseudomonas sp. SLBN-26]|uniref:glycosyltransferase family 4 protein n=1 Tax=Pseudomonadaceae TaxID=135621 RepID=UPI00116FF77D|nr:glycosyltransferase family 4 protein [Pseudomonas sp. SLBN-26]MCP1621164.1 glycosyltransferase involved in cell wall biosynthesis [Pseudomonas otitidis]TQL10367.1 glycosyltransferase involved in cell wall biosynthesis [Pseudomonas sp. SLBN-26]